MERAYERTDSAIRELSSDELSTAELEEVAGGLIGPLAGLGPQIAEAAAVASKGFISAAVVSKRLQHLEDFSGWSVG
jgi:hypothetical protein